MTCVVQDQVEARTLADRVAVLEFGKIAWVGSPREFHRQPVSLFFAKFTGWLKVNVLEHLEADAFPIVDGGEAGQITVRTGRNTEADTGSRTESAVPEGRMHSLDRSEKVV